MNGDALYGAVAVCFCAEKLFGRGEPQASEAGRPAHGTRKTAGAGRSPERCVLRSSPDEAPVEDAG